MKYNIPDRVLRDIFRIAEKNGIKKIILFGSRARGTHWERSDIDLAISGGDALDFYFDLEEEADTLLMFDVVDMNRHITEDLRQEIERDGIVIYEKETNENGSRFNMNFERFYNLYEQIKQMKEFSEFEKERYENNYILNEKPFDKNKANQQVIMLINKYGIELERVHIKRASKIIANIITERKIESSLS